MGQNAYWTAYCRNGGNNMTRTTAREIAIHLAYELGYSDCSAEEFLDKKLTEEYFASIGMPTRLGQLDIDDSKFEEIAEKCTFFGKRTLPDYVTLDKKEIIDIFKLMV